MDRIVVTGGTGFIGKHLVTRLRQDRNQVFAFDINTGNVVNKATWDRYPPADVVVHLAARSFVPDSWKQPKEYIHSNLLGTVNALEFCRKHNARLVYVSSYLYGDPVSLPICESASLSALNPYAFSKKLAEDVCLFYMDAFGVNPLILRPFNVYGAYQSASFLIPSIVSQVRAGHTIHVKDLEPKRDYVYVKDFVDAISKGIDGRINTGIFNIGSGVSYSVGELIATIQGVLGTSLPVVSKDQRRPGEIMDSVADIGAACRELGWTPRFSLADGLQDMLQT